MDVRLFPDGRAFVRNHVLDIEPLDSVNGSSFIIPLDREQVDINSVQIQGIVDNVYLSVKPLSVVTREDNTYVGTLIDYTDERVTLSQGKSKLVIRNYDEIEEAQYIIGKSSSGVVPDELALSYLTSGIHGTVVHSLDVESHQLESDLVVSNNTFNDLNDVQFEVITAEQVQKTYMYARATSLEYASNSAVATPEDSSAGTIYVIDGRYSVPAGFDVSVPLIRNDVNASIIYVIDAPNGQTNATYTLRWIAPADLPPGSLYVYRGGELETVTSIQSTGEGQRRDIPLLVIPSVYARGTITRTDSRPTPIMIQNANGNRISNNGVQTSTADVRLTGVVTNSLSEQVTVFLRYFIGEGKVNISNGTSAQREEQYLVFPLTVAPNSNQSYNFSFTITY